VYIVEFLYFIVFLLAFRYFSFLRLKNNSLWMMPAAFTMKAAVGILFLSMYLHPNAHNLVPSDTMRFMAESKLLNKVFYTSPADYFSLLFGIGDDTALVAKYLNDTFLWDSGSLTLVNDSRNIIRIHSVIHFISFNSPFIHVLFMCAIALIGLKAIYHVFLPYVKIHPKAFFLLLLLFPSTLFWTSGILKEPILLLGIGLFLNALMIKRPPFQSSMMFITSMVVLLSVKPYVLACILPALLFYSIYHFLRKKRIIPSILLFLLVVISTSFIFEKGTQKVVHFLSKKQTDFAHIGKGGLFVKADTCLYYFSPKEYKNLIISKRDTNVQLIHSSKCLIVNSKYIFPPVPHYLKAKGQSWRINYYVGGAMSYIETTPINDSKAQLIKNIPEALVNGFARPFPNDPGSGLKYPAMLEVWILFLFLVYSFFNRRKLDDRTLGIVLSLLLFALFMLILIGWITPVIGAIFRYRFPAQLALIIVGVIILKERNSEAKASPAFFKSFLK
jgi:hypothetical protein